MLCRRGHITRNEVGAIRIGANETFFQIPRAISGKFADAVARTMGDGDDDENVRIEASDTGPREVARAPRKGPPKGRHNGKPKPHRKNNDANARPGPRGKGPAKNAKSKNR